MQRILIWFSLLLANTLAVHYKCLPYPVASVCIIEFIFYQPGEQVTFPEGFNQYRIVSPRSSKSSESKVTAFDEKLYEAMHQPSSVEMASIDITELILPPSLVLGDFADNMLETVNVTSGHTYNITYLDLKANGLTSIDFVSSLVNLEMLHLERNSIKRIADSALSPLTKLKYLYLQLNELTSIPWNELPKSVIHLDFYLCDVESIELTNISLPNLEYLNLKQNFFSAINITSLLLAAPNLQEAYLYTSHIDAVRMVEIVAELKAKNITTAVEHDFDACIFRDDYEYVEGKCVPRDESKVNTGKAVVLSAIVVGLAMMFVYIVVLVFKQMNR